MVIYHTFYELSVKDLGIALLTIGMCLLERCIHSRIYFDATLDLHVKKLDSLSLLGYAKVVKMCCTFCLFQVDGVRLLLLTEAGHRKGPTPLLASGNKFKILTGR